MYAARNNGWVSLGEVINASYILLFLNLIIYPFEAGINEKMLNVSRKSCFYYTTGYS